MLRIFFATDIHGSDICWRKFINTGNFYKADVIILGGDTTGKQVVPIVEYPDGKKMIRFLGREYSISGENELKTYITYIMDSGFYPYRTTPEEMEILSSDKRKLDEIFRNLMIQRWERWIELAERHLKGSNIRCFVAPGNDDEFVIDSIIDSSTVVERVEGKVVEIGGHEMLSSGWTNPTPWNTPRECSEEELLEKIEGMACQLKDPSNSIFNLHAPPYGTRIDEAPILDENLTPTKGGTAMGPVGSKAVLEAIKKYQPLIGLHGHIHESKGMCKIGRTLSFNPGSMYTEGILQGLLVVLDKNKIKSHLFTAG